MSYLLVADAVTMGASSSLTQAQLDQAATIVDAYCHRPEGFKIETAADGSPAAMLQVTGAISFVASTIPAGTGVAVTIPMWLQVKVGDVLVLDRGQNTAEAVVVQSVAGQVVTLKQVNATHNTPVVTVNPSFTIDAAMPAKGRIPIRHKQAIPLSVAVDGALSSFSYDGTAVSTGSLGSRVRIQYVAGYITLPQALKQACINIATNIMSQPDIDPYSSMEIAGIKYANGNSPLAFGGRVDAGTQTLLNPFVQRV